MITETSDLPFPCRRGAGAATATRRGMDAPRMCLTKASGNRRGKEVHMSKRLWVEKNKDGSWDAFSDDGAHIKFGHDRGQFTPGDLVKIALAGCAALSSEFAIEHALGEGHGAKIVVDGTYDADNDSYINFNEQVMIDATDADLSEEDVEKLKKRVKAHIEKGCTVMHTYEQETPVRMDIEVRR